MSRRRSASTSGAGRPAFAASSSYADPCSIALAMVIVQAVDAIIGVRIHDRLKTIGPAATSLANAVALIWLLQQ
jgi:hypothetical protein